MHQGFEILSFAFCYAIAFILELIRARVKETRRISIASFFCLALGATLHGAVLFSRDLLQNSHFFASAESWFLVLAFALVLTQIYLAFAYPRTRFALFFLPLVFALLVVAHNADSTNFTPRAACRVVRATHAISLLLATLASLFGASVGVMFFRQRRRLKQKTAFQTHSLPTLEWLGAASYFATNATIVALGVGVASGFYLKLFAQSEAERAARLDPVACGAAILLACALAARIRAKLLSATKSAALNAAQNIFCCLALVALLFFAAFSSSSHWKTMTDPPNAVSANR